MSPRLKFPSFEFLSALIIIIIFFIGSLPSTATAQETETDSLKGPAQTVDNIGFWLGFTLLFVVSAVECAASLIWARFRVVSDGFHPPELSCRVCGREIFVTAIDWQTAEDIATNGLHSGFHSGGTSSFTFSVNDVVVSSTSNAGGCSTCGGFERMHTEVYRGATEAVIDKFGMVELIPTLLIRRFNPMTSLEAPAGLANNIKDLLRRENKPTRLVEFAVHLIVGTVDIALGVAGLALNPGSVENLYETLKDPETAMSFENYLTLFLLYWLLGAVLLVFMYPLRSNRRSIQMFGWPRFVAFFVASFASLALFGVGCWKIDHARRNGLPWTPMLTYWIGGASAISLPLCGVEVFHTFGVVGLVFMLIHTFN